MSQLELLNKVIGNLNKHDIAYMLTGSIVSSIQGEPRTTHDIDILIELRQNDIPVLVQCFTGERYFLDEESVVDAVKKKQMFNLIDTIEGDKIDFYILPESEYELNRFKRKIQIHILGLNVYISTPEDTIISKLRWCKLSGNSQKQFIDAKNVYKNQMNNLDLHYIKQWIGKLELTTLFEKLLSEVGDETGQN
jgi:predicted nucleotidyltransferase